MHIIQINKPHRLGLFPRAFHGRLVGMAIATQQLIVPKLKRCSLPEHPFTIMGLGDQHKVMLRKTEHHFILVAVIADSKQHPARLPREERYDRRSRAVPAVVHIETDGRP
jgi:hypothetical protein